MDIQILVFVFIIYFVEFTTQNRNDDMWEALSCKYIPLSRPGTMLEMKLDQFKLLQ